VLELWFRALISDEAACKRARAGSMRFSVGVTGIYPTCSACGALACKVHRKGDVLSDGRRVEVIYGTGILDEVSETDSPSVTSATNGTGVGVVRGLDEVLDRMSSEIRAMQARVEERIRASAHAEPAAAPAGPMQSAPPETFERFVAAVAVRSMRNPSTAAFRATAMLCELAATNPHAAAAIERRLGEEPEHLEAALCALLPHLRAA
jgi:hypothetical protein